MTRSLDREIVLLVDDNCAITDALSVLLEQPGRTTIVCSDVESAEIMMARMPVTHLICDVQFGGSFGFEGLHFLGRVRSQAPECRIVLMTGNPSAALRTEAIHRGADALLAKPFAIDKLEEALGSRTGQANGEYEIVRVAPLEEILAGDTLAIVFQPIVRIGNGSAESFAFEALARVRGDWPADIATLFQYAERCDGLRALNVLALRRAIEAASELPADANVFINLDPSAFTSDLPGMIAAATERAGVSPGRIVLEITERSEFADPAAVAPIFDELRDLGVRFALDDHGSAYSHLSIIDSLRPSFMKISNSYGTGFEEDATQRRIVTNVASLARDFGCETILEGIESAQTERAAAALGIELAQGYQFGRPGAAASWRNANAG